MRIDLSCDMGEASNAIAQANEDALWPLVSSASVACGGHAGDTASMTHAVEMATRFGVLLTAHPSYPDRENFGRKSMALEPGALAESISTQIDALRSVARNQGASLGRVKPHGALYNDLHRDRALAEIVASALAAIDPGLAVVAAPGSMMSDVARERGMTVVLEAFADRRYRSDGSLVPRGREDALLTDVDEAAEQALRLARSGEAVADNGTSIVVPFQTLCIHGDMPGAVERLRRIRECLELEGFEIGIVAGGAA